MHIKKEVYYYDGKVLFESDIPLRRLWTVGGQLVHAYKSYTVEKVDVIDEIEHVYLAIIGGTILDWSKFTV